MIYSEYGYSLSTLNDDELLPIKNKILNIQNNFDKAKPYNKNLAGNIQHEYQLTNKEYLNDLLLPYIKKHEDHFHYLDNLSFLSKSVPIVLGNPWVNFQKKYEFNPTHTHTGAYSFVIWIDIPYSIQDEMNTKSSKNSNINIPGHFQFLLTDYLGKIIQINIPTDKTYNNKMIIFPSCYMHAVYPFYTSDNYRISVSGNFHFEV